jgi:hypothetical protein
MTDTIAPRGRGRPRKTFTTEPMSAALDPAGRAGPIAAYMRTIEAAAAPTAETDATPQKRRRRASVGGHALKLQAPARPGYSRRWLNDEGNRIADAEELGYDHVHEAGLQTSGPGSRISRLVGTKANGEPLHAFLMETPDELFAEGVAEKEAHNRQIDDAIIAGRDSTGQMSQVPSSETYGQGSIRRDR